MQNKINQKVPIAKMDELITAIRESGGGGGKLYKHSVGVKFGTSGKTGDGKIILYNKSPDKITILTNAVVSDSLSVIYPRVYIYNAFFNIMSITSINSAIAFQENQTSSDVTHTTLDITDINDTVTEF